MKKILLITLLLGLMLFTGCENSFDSCIRYCRNKYHDNFTTEHLGYDPFWERNFTYETTDWDSVDNMCFEKCTV